MDEVIDSILSFKERFSFKTWPPGLPQTRLCCYMYSSISLGSHNMFYDKYLITIGHSVTTKFLKLLFKSAKTYGSNNGYG